MAAEFQHGLFGCFDNIGLCIISYFVPCYQFGKNAEAVGENCLLCGLLFLIPVVDLFLGAHIRTKIRDSKNIGGSFIGDLVYWWCCPCCALVQEAQELEGGVRTQSIARQ